MGMVRGCGCWVVCMAVNATGRRGADGLLRVGGGRSRCEVGGRLGGACMGVGGSRREGVPGVQCAVCSVQCVGASGAEWDLFRFVSSEAWVLGEGDWMDGWMDSV